MTSPLAPAACLILVAAIAVTTQIRLVQQQQDVVLSVLRNEVAASDGGVSVCRGLGEMRSHLLYMDELFHVPQVMRTVVAENYTYYDPMLTTPPGAYIVPAIALHVLKPPAPLQFAVPDCSTFVEELAILRKWADGCVSTAVPSARHMHWYWQLYDVFCGAASSSLLGQLGVRDSDSLRGEAHGLDGNQASMLEAVSQYGLMVHALRLSGVVQHGLVWIIIVFIDVSHRRSSNGESVGRLRRNPWCVVLCAMYPPLLLSSLLVYTDVASAASVAAMVLLAPSGLGAPKTASALHAEGATSLGKTWAHWCCVAAVGLVSITIRQSNVVWLFFVAAKFVAEGCARTEECGGEIAQPFSVFAVRCGRIVCAASPCLVVALMFVEFVRRNGGIVLGDKSSHVAVFHPAQLVYLCATTAMFLPFQSLAATVLQLRLRPRKTFAVLLVGALCGWYALTHHVWFHPYLVADNRHYTNVLYRKVLQDAFRRVVILVPLALAGLLFFVGLVFPVESRKRNSPHRVSRSPSAASLVALLFFFCAALVVVPQRLIEFRYFAPVICVGLLTFGGGGDGYSVVASRTAKNFLDVLVSRAAMLDVVVAIMIHAATCFVFTERTFVAPDGTVGRFMW